MHYLLAKGNTTVFEYKTGTTPDSVEEFRLNSLIADLGSDHDQPSSKAETDEDGGVCRDYFRKSFL